ncbi:hypothetical protein BDZ89DRAFT_882403, partial [Hymenopellis radicata]
KGMKAAVVLGRLAKMGRGMSMGYVRRLYIGLVVPRMEYPLVVWYTPVMEEGKRRKESVGALKLLSQTQNVAMRVMTGALCTTPLPKLSLLSRIPP